jgi:hypothetical protein
MTAGLEDYDGWTPVIPSDQLLGSNTAANLAAGTSVGLGTFQIARSSYYLEIDALASSGGTIPLPYVDMTWVDPATSQVIAHEQWAFVATTASPATSNGLTFGRGPTKTAQLEVTLTNPDPSEMIAYDWALYQSTRTVTRDDWRTLNLGATAGYTIGNASESGLVIGWKAVSSLASGAQTVRLTGLYAGPAQFCVTQSAGESLAWQIQAAIPNVAAGSWPIIAAGVTSADASNTQVTLPRYPSLVTVTNNGGAATTTGWTLVAQEVAS